MILYIVASYLAYINENFANYFFKTSGLSSQILGKIKRQGVASDKTFQNGLEKKGWCIGRWINHNLIRFRFDITLSISHAQIRNTGCPNKHGN